MSATFGACALRIRQMLGDLDPDRYLVSSPKLHRMLLSKSLEWGPRAGYGEAWTTSVLSLSDTGSSDFLFSAVIQYQQIKHMRLATTGLLIERVAPAAIELLRQGAPLAAGIPNCFYLIETTAARVEARFYPRPNIVDTVDALVSVLPSNSALTSDSLAFSDTLIEGIVKEVASGVVTGLPPDRAQASNLTPDLAQRWHAEGLALLNEEIKRQSAQKRAPVWRTPVLR